MMFNKLYRWLISENTDGMNTYWEDEGDKVTIRDVIDWLDKNNIEVEEVDIEKIKPIIIDQDYEGKNKSRVKKSSSKYPIIVIKNKGKFKSILDGNHRAFKALSNGDKTIKIRVIDLSSKDTPSLYKKLFNYKIDSKFK